MATVFAAAAERSSDRLFHTAMGLAIALLVFAGYAQSYYLSRWVEPPARANIASLADAQQGNAEARIGKLESEMRAVQRKVFPGGAAEPQPTSQASSASPGPPARSSSVVADLASRIDALEAQLARITGQVEEDGYRARRLEEEIGTLRTWEEARATPAEAAKQPSPTPSSRALAPATSNSGNPPQRSGDPAEDAYLAGYRLWEQGKFMEAQTALQAVAKTYPKHRCASWALNLAGRAYLDAGQPAAARILLGNYQDNPKGERAADSLYYLGQALTKLRRFEQACHAFDELQEVYGKTMRSFLKQSLPEARSAAKCE